MGVVKEVDNDIYVEVGVKIDIKIDVNIDVDVDTGVTGSKKGHNIEVDGAWYKGGRWLEPIEGEQGNHSKSGAKNWWFTEIQIFFPGKKESLKLHNSIHKDSCLCLRLRESLKQNWDDRVDSQKHLTFPSTFIAISACDFRAFSQ